MRKIKISLMLIILGAVTFGSWVRGADTIAVILKVKGSVTVTKAGGNNSNDVKRGYRLEEGDKLITGTQSFVALRFIDDASLVRIGANSTCTIQGRKDQKEIVKNIMVEVGTIVTRITNQKGRFQVATPTSVASVKGTEWTTDVRATFGARFFIALGLVEISSDGGTVTANPGETVIVTTKDSEPVVRPTIEGEIPEVDEIEEIEEEFEFEFENEDGQKKTLKFKAIKKG